MGHVAVNEKPPWQKGRFFYLFSLSQLLFIFSPAQFTGIKRCMNNSKTERNIK
jgi:hypothetical protein